MSDSHSTSAPVPPADAPLLVAAFLARYLADQAAGAPQSLARYQALFPGHEALIAQEFARLAAGEPALEDVVGERLAGYRILGELGRGGQGIVYLALDERLDRKVALKVLPGVFGAAAARQRLLREAQAASRLDDPAICTVYDAGEAAGIAYIAMRYVEGESVAARIGREQRDGVSRVDPARVQALLGAFATVARALHAAHEKGLVHRDVKPSNLMLEASGQPVVLDFGLAHFDDHPDGTLTGDAVLGTPAYMSPEQLAAQRGRVDRRSDVFSLAVTLYEALTLQHPFAAATRECLFERVLGEEPVPPSRLVRGLPRDLDVVLACALDKDRDRRYATAQAFADDLARVCERRPVAARPAPLWLKGLRLVQRHPLATAVVSLLLLASVATAAVFAYHSERLGRSLRETERQRLRAKAALFQEQELLRRYKGMLLASESAVVTPRDAELGALLAQAGLALHADVQTRGALLQALGALRPRPTLPGVRDASWVRVSGDGERVAVPVGDEVWLFDAKACARVGTLACPGAQHAAVWWMADHSRLVVAAENELLRLGQPSVNKRISLYDGSGARLAELPAQPGRVSGVAFAKAHVVLAFAPENPDHDADRGGVQVCALVDGASVWSRSDLGAVVDVRFDTAIDLGRTPPDVDALGAHGLYRRLLGRDGEERTRRQVYDATARPRPRAELLAAGRVVIHDGAELRCVSGRAGDLAKVTSVVPAERWSHDGASVVLWSPRGGRLQLGPGKLQTLDVPARELVHVAFGQREVARGRFVIEQATTTIAVGTVDVLFADGSLRSWRLDTKEYLDIAAVGGGVRAAHSSSEGHVIATLGVDGAVRVFAREGAPALPRATGIAPESFAALSPDGALAAAFVAGAPVLVELASGLLRPLPWASDAGSADGWVTAFAPDGAQLAVGDEEGAVHVFARDPQGQWQVRGKVAGGGEAATALQFSPDGRTLAVARNALALLDVERAALLRELRSPLRFSTVLFAAEGTRLVAAGPAGHRVFAAPSLEPVDGLAADAPRARPGVPVAAHGARVLLGHELWVPQHRVGRAGPAQLLDARDASVRELTGRAGVNCWPGALLADGRHAVLPRSDGVLLLVDLDAPDAQPDAVQELSGHARAANCVRVAGDGSCFASTFASRGFPDQHDERELFVRDAAGRALLRLEFPSGVRWFELDARGEWLVVLTGDGELQRLPVHVERFAQSLALRPLTAAEISRHGVVAPR